MLRRSSLASPALALLCTIALSACAATHSESPSDPSGSSGAALPSDRPVVIDNCGTEVVMESPPERIITVKSSMTELLLALGAGDRIVAQAFPDGEIPARWSPNGGIPVLSESAPGRESVLALAPDLVVAGWESVFSADSAGERDGYHDLGIATYVAPSACKGETHQPDRMTVELLENQIREAALLVGADPEPFLAEQAETLSAIEPDSRGLTALWYSSGTDVPYVGAGIGNPQLIMDLIGLDNVAGSVDDTWTSMSWEAIIDADPDVIVLVDSTWNSAQQKRDLLESSAATANLDAVLNGRYLVIPFASTEAGARTAWAAADLSAQLMTLEMR